MNGNRYKSAILITALVMGSASVLAQPADPPRSGGQQSGMGMQGGGMMDDRTTERLQENMRKMQTQMEQIRATKDDKERERLMDEHMKTMREGMGMMRNMGGGMMQGMTDGGARSGGPDGMAPGSGDMPSRMEMMERRMDMMQTMMEHMTESRQIERRHEHRDGK